MPTMGATAPGPVVAATRSALQKALAVAWRGSADISKQEPFEGGHPVGVRLALVPTMGALHDGHGSLFDEARRRAEVVVASIFVNPLQFSSDEHVGRYPRTLADDVALCQRHGVDVVFAPAVEEMYPDGQPVVTVDPGPLGNTMEGAVRPGHFKGVLTVVLKLFCLVRPDVAVFGEKDYQQLVLVRRMARDLSLAIDVAGTPTVRSVEGLALSSRNRFLAPQEAAAALTLSRALHEGRESGAAGPAGVLAAAERVLAEEPSVLVDYLALRSPDLVGDVTTGPARLLVAARVGGTRLIDNTAVSLDERPSLITSA